MWNKSISMPVNAQEIQDAAGFVTAETQYITGIPANFLDITRNDEILAAQKGYNADMTIEIMACNYTGASFLIDESDGTVYDIIRTFRKDKSMKVQCLCERRERGEFRC